MHCGSHPSRNLGEKLPVNILSILCIVYITSPNRVGSIYFIGGVFMGGFGFFDCCEDVLVVILVIIVIFLIRD
jgi:hypothetical protein